MATAATKSRKPAKRGSKSKSRAKAVQDRPARQAFAYGDRVDVLVDALDHLGGSATVNELFEQVESEQFATPRRISATWRQNVRHLPESAQPFTFDGRSFHLATKPKRQRKTAKSRGQRKSGTVSRKRTRASK